MKPLCIDLFCGLGGWAEGFLAEGYDVIGFDIERHDYGTGGYPGQLVLQDVRTLHGSQFRDAAVIVASPPCQKYSYMAMPWTRGKAMANDIRASQQKWAELNELFVACFRIAHEAGIPLIVENVKGAEPWVGRARWHFGSFYLWGDLPALMPSTKRAKVPGLNWKLGSPTYTCKAFNTTAEQHLKNSGGSWFNIAHNTTSGKGNNPDGRKLPGNNSPRRWEDREVKRPGDATKGTGGTWFTYENSPDTRGNVTRLFSSKSIARKAASAHIAKIPFPLAKWIAKCFKPQSKTKK